jgi:hypothetical protein
MTIKPQIIGIIGAMEKEIELLQQSMTNTQSHQFGQLSVYSGELDGKSVALCLSGIGKVNAAIATTILIEHFAADCIINTGSAGGLRAELHIGDAVIGTQVAHHDVNVTAFGYTHGQVPQMAARFNSHVDLVRAAELAAPNAGLRVYRGLVASGDQFIHSESDRQLIRQHFPDIVAVEMEAAAIAQTCVVLNKPFVIIRAISDTADSSAAISFDEFLQTAAVHSAQLVRGLIQNI